MFDEINDTLPRIESYVGLLGDEPSLVEPCEESKCATSPLAMRILN
jgi:hypothetical protein